MKAINQLATQVEITLERIVGDHIPCYKYHTTTHLVGTVDILEGKTLKRLLIIQDDILRDIVLT